jgi:hypothetical protein
VPDDKNSLTGILHLIANAANLTILGARPIRSNVVLDPYRSHAVLNPKDLLGIGTPGFRPPEQIRLFYDKTVSLVPDAVIGEKAMVYGFAASMFKVSAEMRSSQHLLHRMMMILNNHNRTQCF